MYDWKDFGHIFCSLDNCNNNYPCQEISVGWCHINCLGLKINAISFKNKVILGNWRNFAVNDYKFKTENSCKEFDQVKWSLKIVDVGPLFWC